MQENDRKGITLLLKYARGQLNGLLKKNDWDDKYSCLNTSAQILATQALLRRANVRILRQYVTEVFEDVLTNVTDEAEADKKIDEAMEAIIKILKMKSL